MLNILEAFFRRPWLHLLPLILMLALGATTVASTKAKYVSVGTLSATNESLLNDVTGSASSAFTFETQAVLTSRQINELLRTEEFLDRVAQRAGVTATAQSNELLRAEIRSSISAFADGDTLVRVNATTRVPDQSQRLAQATIDAFLEQAVLTETEDSESTEEFLTARVNAAETKMLEAQKALDDEAIAQGGGALDQLDLAEQVKIQRLQATADRAESQYEEALTALENAQLETEKARTVVEQRLKQLDAPQLGIKQAWVRKAALTLILFGVLGVLMSLALVVVTATLDRTIRVPNDITARYGLDVLAVVPDMRR